MGPHVIRATPAINVLDNGADIAKVQEGVAGACQYCHYQHL
ncbi:hypothetical protein [Nitrosospira multiformis]|nr:hypothetical protein [Nitrosospira multiformis]